MKHYPFFLSASLSLFTLSAANGATVLGIGTAALLGGDITDPENDGVDVENTAGTNFNWSSISATAEAFFTDATAGGPSEGSYDIFDNKVGGGEAKYCCGAANWSVTIQMPIAFELSHFTATSSNDSIGRDPDVWQIQGSTDGTNWTNIYSYNNEGTTPWSARNQVVRFDGAGSDFTTPAAYDWFRINVDSVTSTQGSGGAVALGELELFGTPVPEPSGTILCGLAALGFALRRKR